MFAWLGRSALMMSPFGDVLKMIPGKVWLYSAIVIAVAVGIAAAHHRHAVAIQRVKDDAYAQGRADELHDQLAAQRKANAAAADINAKQKEKTDAETRAIARDADGLRLLGAGRAACPRPAASSAAAGGHVAPRGSADAAVAEVPDPQRVDLIAVPRADLIDFAEHADANRAEVNAWRESDAKQRALAEQSQPKE